MKPNPIAKHDAYGVKCCEHRTIQLFPCSGITAQSNQEAEIKQSEACL
jgi:hypothetical protein